MVLPLFFARRFKAPPRSILHCGRQNVVLHAKMKIDAIRLHLREHLSAPSRSNTACEQYSSASPESQFRHARYNMGTSGKILAFRSAANIIRAGKHTHADALASCLLFLRWSKHTGWPTRIDTPNLVASGKLATEPSAQLKTHPAATSSSKFPGIAIKLKSGITTEIYESGAFILPGVTSADQLSAALHEVASLQCTQ